MYVHGSLWCLIADVGHTSQFKVMFTVSSGVVNWVHTIHLKRFSTKTYYCIAGNIWGSKLSQISWFCGYSRKFPSHNLEMWHYLAQQKRTIHKRSLHESCIFHKFAIVFSLESFPLILTYFPAISERNPLYGIRIHLSQTTNIWLKGFWILSRWA